jgi:hypothetical protein
VRLAFRLGDLHQIGIREPRRLRQHRARDRDIVIMGEPAQDLDRRISDRRQPPRKLGAGPGLDFGDQVPEHVVEQTHVIFVEALRLRQEQIGNAGQRLGPLLYGAALDDLFEFRDEGGDGSH